MHIFTTFITSTASDSVIAEMSFAAGAAPRVACREIGRWARERYHAGVDVTTADGLLLSILAGSPPPGWYFGS